MLLGTHRLQLLEAAVCVGEGAGARVRVCACISAGAAMHECMYACVREPSAPMRANRVGAMLAGVLFRTGVGLSWSSTRTHTHASPPGVADVGAVHDVHPGIRSTGNGAVVAVLEG